MTELEYALENLKPIQEFLEEHSLFSIKQETLQEDITTKLIPLVFSKEAEEFIIWQAGIIHSYNKERDDLLIVQGFLTINNRRIIDCYVLPVETKEELEFNEYLINFKEDLLRRVSLKNDYNRLIEIVRAAEEIYGEDKVDLKLDNKEIISLIVHYPEIDVEDEHGNKETIFNSYICYPFKLDVINEVLRLRNSIKMFSSHGTFEQAGAGYIHSHAGTKNLEYFFSRRDLCLGATDLRCLVDELKDTSSLNEVEVVTFEALFYQVDELLVWESEDGGPYIKLAELGENLSGYKYLSTSDYLDEDDLTNFLQQAFKNIDMLEEPYNFGNNAFIYPSVGMLVDAGESFSSFTNVINSYYNEYDNEYSIIRELDNDSNLALINNSCKPYLTFRNKPINYVIDYENKSFDTTATLPPRLYVEALFGHLSKCLQDLEERKRIESTSLPRDISENLVFM
jgi:hypothetical protein